MTPTVPTAPAAPNAPAPSSTLTAPTAPPAPTAPMTPKMSNALGQFAAVLFGIGEEIGIAFLQGWLHKKTGVTLTIPGA